MSRVKKIIVFGVFIFSLIGLLVFFSGLPSEFLNTQNFEITTEKNDWRANEEPEFKINKNVKGLKIEATPINPDGQALTLKEGKDFELKSASPIKIKIFRPQNFKPGAYKLKVSFETNGQIHNFEQEFTWGVLAINTNKSIYLPGETAYLQMATLRDDGHAVCDANLKLEITSPGGELFSATVQKSGECGPNNVTDLPDYFTYHQVGEPGAYQMILTNLDNGYEITDFFEVRESVPFDIERIGPTRIYPPATYEMRFIIKANQDFQGRIIETVPASFWATEDESIQQEVENNDKRIIWYVDWKEGETYELNYQFDAPDVSPYLYLLGPLSFNEAGSRSDTFKEARQWQIAADAAGDVILLWDNPNITPSVWTCVSCLATDNFYQVFPRASSTPGTASTSANTHTHTITPTASSTGAAGGTGGSGTTLDAQTHSHSWSSFTSGSGDLRPPFQNLRFVARNAPETLPTGIIGIFDVASTSLPSGWTYYSTMAGLYLCGENTTSTDGSSSHTHSINETSGDSVNIATDGGKAAGQTNAGGVHNHTISGDTPPADNAPPFINVVFAKLNATSSIPAGLIAMFDNINVPANWTIVSTSGSPYLTGGIGRLLKGSDTFGTTGGTATHTHATFATTSSAAPTGSTVKGDSVSLAGPAHTHIVTSTVDVTSSLPVYRDVVFAKYVPPPAPTLNQRSVVWQNDDGDAAGDPTTGGYANNNTTSTNPDTSLTMEKGERATWRAQIDNTGAGATTTVYKMRWATTTPGGCTSTLANWYDVTATSEIAWSYGLSGTNGENVTGTVTNTSNSCGDGSCTGFATGTWQEAVATTSSHTLTNDWNTEFGFMIQTKNAIASTTYCLQLINNNTGQPLDNYYKFGELFIATSTTKRYSKNATSSLPLTTTDLTYFLDNKGYSNVNADDGNRDPIRSSSNYPVFLFAKKHINNTDNINISWDGQSTVACGTNAIYLQVYNFNSSSWQTFASSTTCTVNTDFPLETTISTNRSDYYESGAYWVYVRAYQDLGSQTLRTDYISIAFVTPGNNVSGTVCTAEVDCATNNVGSGVGMVLQKNGTGNYTATTTAGGAYQFTGITGMAANDVLTIYVGGTGSGDDNPTYNAVTVTKIPSVQDYTGIDLVTSRAVVRHEGSITELTDNDMNYWDSGNDTDVHFLASSSTLAVENTEEFHIWTGKTFRPAGTLTTSATGTASGVGADIHIDTGATLNMETNALSVGGDYTNSGTFSNTSPQATTFTATGAGFLITPGTGNFYNITFNGSGGGWSFSSAVTIDGDLTMAAGTLNNSNGTGNITVNGNVIGAAGVIDMTASGHNFKQRVAAADKNFGPTTANTDWAFVNLIFSNSSDSAKTIIAQSCSDCDVTVSGTLTIGEAGDSYSTTLSAGDKTWTLSGTGTSVLVFNASSILQGGTSTFKFTGNAATTIPAVNAGSGYYYNLQIYPGVASVVHSLGSGTFDIDGDLTLGDGTNSGTEITAATYNPQINLAGNLTLCSSPCTNDVTFTKGTGTLTFDGSGTKTWTDNNSSRQDIGNVAINGTTLTINLGSSAKATGINIYSNQTLSVNGSNTLTLTGSGTPLTRSGAFTASTGTVEYTSDSGVTALSSAAMTGSNAFYNLTINGAGNFTLGVDIEVTNDLMVTSGALAGTNNVTANGNVTGAGTVNLTGGTFTHSVSANKNLGSNSDSNNWTFNILVLESNSGTPTIIFSAGGTGQIIVSNNLTLINNGASLTVDNNTNDRILDVNNNVTIGTNTTFQASDSASFYVGGNWSNSGTFNHLGGTVVFNGDSSATLDSGCSDVNTCTNGVFYNLQINKTSGNDADDNLTLSNSHLRTANTLTITDGELIQATPNIDLNVRVEGATAVSISSAGKWTNTGRGDLILGGAFVNNGTVNFRADNKDCNDFGYTDYIQIRSTQDDVQRSWSGNNTIMYHIDVKDQGGTALITIYDGTDSEGNGDNFSFLICEVAVVLIGKGRDAYQLEKSGAEIICYINDSLRVTGQISKGWNHVALTYDKNSGEIKLYINGVEVDSVNYSTSIFTNDSSLKIGDSFSGKIDEAKIYNLALSNSQISQNYNASKRTIINPTQGKTIISQ